MTNGVALEWFLEEIQKYPYDSDAYKAYDHAIDALIEVMRGKEK